MTAASMTKTYANDYLGLPLFERVPILLDTDTDCDRA
jgi:hypothetical protein